MSDRTDIRIIPAQPQRTEKYIVGQNCDRCGKDVPEPTSYSRRDFTLEFLEGSSYPEGTDLTGWRVKDCCDDCLKVLKNLLEAGGFNITPHEQSF